MNILVCIKQVPNTVEIRIDPLTNTLKRDGVESIINPDDKAGLEAALLLKERHGAFVTVMSMGPTQAKKALLEALVMGADRAILLNDRLFAGSDTLATSRVLAAAARKLEFDLLIAGRQAIDGDTAQVGPQLAEHLNLPQVTYVNQIDYRSEDDTFTVKQKASGAVNVYECASPMLITVLSSIAKPRYMRVSRLTALSDADVEVWTADDIDVDKTQIGLSGSPTRVKSTFNKQADGGARELFELEPAQAARVIADKLAERRLGGLK